MTRYYLSEAITLPPIGVLLSLFIIYTFFQSGKPFGWLMSGLVVTLFLIAVRIPRWIVYLIFTCGVITFIGWNIFVGAKGSQNMSSDRNEAVEIATSELLAGNNPWSSKSVLDLPITTGPSSILIALPFVSIFHSIDILSLIIWSAFIIVLALFDIRLRNNSFLMASLLLFSPWVGFLHTMHWALDELYYAAILFPLLWLAFVRGNLKSAGFICGFIVLSRLSYAPAVIATYMWWILQERRSLLAMFSVASWSIISIITIISIFVIIGGQDFLQNNFWGNSQMSPFSITNNHVINLKNNPVAYLLGSLMSVLPQGQLGSASLVVIIIIICAIFMRHINHPFYHIAIASMLAHTISFSPKNPLDYQLTFIIPVLYGICLSSIKNIKPGNSDA